MGQAFAQLSSRHGDFQFAELLQRSKHYRPISANIKSGRRNPIPVPLAGLFSSFLADFVLVVLVVHSTLEVADPVADPLSQFRKFLGPNMRSAIPKITSKCIG
jgi:hypothetical protein